MKTIIFYLELITAILLLLISSQLNAQALDRHLGDLERLIIQIDSVRNSNLPYITKMQFVEKTNKQSLSALISYAKYSTDFMSENLFNSKYAIKIENLLFWKTSKNRQFRIVYWKNGLGGSIQDYQYTLFWTQQNHLNYKIIPQGDTLLANSYIDSIYQFKYDSKELYYVLTETGDRSYYSMNLIGYRLGKNGNIEENRQVFHIGRKNLSQISFNNYPKESFINLVHFNNTGDTLYFPYMSSSSLKHKTYFDTLPKYDVYVFRHGHFEYIDK